jgi:hypothetical protein
MSDIESLKLYRSIASKLNLEAADIDGDEFAALMSLEELVVLQKEITKAIARKVLK